MNSEQKRWSNEAKHLSGSVNWQGSWRKRATRVPSPVEDGPRRKRRSQRHTSENPTEVQEGACWPSKTVNLSYDPQKVTLTKIEEVLDDIGYTVAK